MITLYGFGKVIPPVIGETRDLRIEWALEETGLPYRVHGVDHSAGEHRAPAYAKISPFNLLPAIEDDGITLAESGAILLYLAEKAGRLIPADIKSRAAVLQWCFAALNTVERPCLEIQLIDTFGGDDQRRAQMVKQATRWLEGLERALADREWIAGRDFTIADLLLATVLRQIRKTDLTAPYPNVRAFYVRAFGRPAWRRALEAYARRLGVDVQRIH